MMKAGIDQDTLVTLFAEASARQSAALRQAVAAATLKALQGRELTLENVRKVVKNVATAASTGAAQNRAPAVDVEAMLGQALAGIDAALLQAVEANRKALEQFVSHGVGLTEKPMKSALANIEKMEDVFFDAVAKAGRAAGPLQAPWEQALASLRMKGSETGAQATQTVEDLIAQAQTTLRDTRAGGVRAAQTMLDSYAALVSGVLIGMSEGMRGGRSQPAEPADAAATPAAKKAQPARKRRSS